MQKSNENTPDEIILQIRQLRLQGVTFVSLSNRFHLPINLIRCICKNIKGRHIALGIETSLYKYSRRAACGIDAGKSKLKEEHVRTIRDLIDQGFLLKQIASLYGVDISTISDISTGRSWRHLPQNDDETQGRKTG